MAIQKYKGHLALLGAAIMWGLMSPIGKTALENAVQQHPYRKLSKDPALFSTPSQIICPKNKHT